MEHETADRSTERILAYSLITGSSMPLQDTVDQTSLIFLAILLHGFILVLFCAVTFQLSNQDHH